MKKFRLYYNDKNEVRHETKHIFYVFADNENEALNTGVMLLIQAGIDLDYIENDKKYNKRVK